MLCTRLSHKVVPTLNSLVILHYYGGCSNLGQHKNFCNNYYELLCGCFTSVYELVEIKLMVPLCRVTSVL